jgi:hypothetical protein
MRLARPLHKWTKYIFLTLIHLPNHLLLSLLTDLQVARNVLAVFYLKLPLLVPYYALLFLLWGILQFEIGLILYRHTCLGFTPYLFLILPLFAFIYLLCALILH